ncbi:MAG: tRNA pseudouridine(38-40) synthase TruA [Prolixibacteraceae bacterium]|nr:tRNA pseudouridine(38-40) synthase TruA [Prolixibacteraceae bacterium]
MENRTKTRYFLQLAYNGTDFHGWQFQPNAITVQEVLGKALSLLLRETIEVTGAGRTDTGVHASFYVAHFETSLRLDEPLKHVAKLNGLLPRSIRIDQLFEVHEQLHARFDAISRTYHYYISTHKEPFRDQLTSFVPYALNLELMNLAAGHLLKTTDFTSFSKLHTDVKTNNCKVVKAEWTQREGLLVFEIQADRFLRNMVRAIVGSLVDVGRGKSSIDDFKMIIESRDRSRAGASALAKGLFLSDIQYPEPWNSQLIRLPLPH